LKGLFQLLLSPYILTSSSILRRGFRSRQTDRLSSRHLAPQALMLMPMIMSGTVMATATLAAMISLRIMSSSVCDGAQTVMEGVRPFMWGQGSQNASACFPWPLADHLPRPLQSRLQALHQMPKSFPGAPVCNPSGAWASDARPRRDADALQRPVFIPPPPPARGRPPLENCVEGLTSGVPHVTNPLKVARPVAGETLWQVSTWIVRKGRQPATSHQDQKHEQGAKPLISSIF
jgi:hypothetical protein